MGLQANLHVITDSDGHFAKRPRQLQRKTLAVNRDNLHKLSKPVVKDRTIPHVNNIHATLPRELHALYLRLNDVKFGTNTMPGEIREQMRPHLEAFFDSYFREPVEDSTENTKLKALAVLPRVLEFVKEAHSCETNKRHESQWNNFVHSPILKLVFPTRNPGLTPEEPHNAGVQCETVMFAPIAGPWIPTFGKKKDGSVLNLACSVSADTVEDSAGSPVSTKSLSLTEVHSRVTSKKVDYVLALELPDGDPLKVRAMLLAEVPAPADNCLTYVNQTIYRPLFENLIAVSIETKASSESKTDSFVQLCIWVAAWHNRMESLRMQLLQLQDNLPSSSDSAAETEGSGSRLPSNRLVSVPMIEVIGHNWVLHFACDEGNSIRTYGPVEIGSTKSVLEVYKLISSLEAIGAWIRGTFRERMGEWFGIDNNHLPAWDHGDGKL